MDKSEPGRIVSIVDEHETRESGIMAPVPKPQSMGDVIVLGIIALLVGGFLVWVCMLIFGFMLTPKTPDANNLQQGVPPVQNNSARVVPRQ